jgi:hypothetical protein
MINAILGRVAYTCLGAAVAALVIFKYLVA